jgi:spore germination cell wall hydrolase CwlJ-like protein
MTHAGIMRAWDLNVLARTCWGEARGQGNAAMAAVAHVVLNRVRDARRWPNSIPGVCLQPLQFSCWNANDPNRPRLIEVNTGDEAFVRALEVAGGVMDGGQQDTTNGANHFHTPAVHPAWSHGQTPVAIIGGHMFFKL